MQPDNQYGSDQSAGYQNQQQYQGQYSMPQYGAMPPQQPQQKKKLAINVWLVLFIVAIVLLLGAISFGIWAYMQRQDFKDNVDKKIAEAVAIARKEISDEKDKEYIEKEKAPFKEYTSPSTVGSIKIVYPKTWSASVNEKQSGTTLVTGFFHPNFVPGSESGTDFALRLEVTNEKYDQFVKSFDGKVKGGQVKVSPYKAPKVESALGSRIDGEINKGQKDSMVVFPLRDKTVKIWTESTLYLNDFNNIILENLTFIP